MVSHFSKVIHGVWHAPTAGIERDWSDCVGMVGLGVDCTRCLFASPPLILEIYFSLTSTFESHFGYSFGPVSMAAQSVLFVSGLTANQAHFALGVATAVRCDRSCIFCHLNASNPKPQELETSSVKKMPFGREYRRGHRSC